MPRIIIELNQDYDPDKVLILIEEDIKEKFEGLNALKEIRTED